MPASIRNCPGPVVWATIVVATLWILTQAGTRAQEVGLDRPRSDARDSRGDRSDVDEAVPRRGEALDRSERPERRDSQRAAANVRVEDLRAADLGLWFERQTRDGLVIADVASSGAIGQFGFREGDRIVSVNGQPVRMEGDFVSLLLGEETLYDRLPVVVLRGGRRRIVYVRPEVFLTQLQAAAVDPLEQFGVELDDRYTSRIVVWRVLPRSPAYYAGIRAGDIITTIKGQRIFDAGEFVRLIDTAEPAMLEVQVIRGQQARDLYLDLSNAEALAAQRDVAERPTRVERTRGDAVPVDPYSERRLSPRPDVPPGMRVPGGEVGRDRVGPISPPGAALGTPTTPPSIPR